MIVISSREFRDHQKKYFDLIDDNEQVIVQRGKNKSYKLVPIMQDESLMTETEFYAKIDRALKQAEEGKVLEIKSAQEFKSFLGL
ncbi:prevent-host-death protein [Flavobacterium sp. XS2P14]|uniref:prevent-host-death protein n=1 Tax=Flavobacterium sp. XS2P14 TaxID=3401735 RepID=UPI003AAD59F6